MRRILLILSFVGLCGCIDHQDYDIHSVTVQPNIVLPLVTGELSIADVLRRTDSLYVFVDADGVIYLDYNEPMVSSLHFSLPDQSVTQQLKIDAGVVPPHQSDLRVDSTEIEIDLNLHPEQLTFVDFKSGFVNTTQSQIPGTQPVQGLEIELTSPDLISKSTGKSFKASAGNTGIAMSDYAASLAQNKLRLKMTLLLKANTHAQTITGTSRVNGGFSLLNMDYKTVKGFLGTQNLSPATTFLKIDAFGESLNGATVVVKNPIVELQVLNGFGVPSQTDFLPFEARKEGGVLAAVLNPANPIDLKYPTIPGTSAFTNITVANANQLVDFGPTGFYVAISTTINKGLTSGTNFMADTSKLRVNLHVRIPLYGHVSAIKMTDTTSIDLSKLDQSKVDTAALRINVVNQLPLDASLQCYVADEHYVILDSVLLAADQPIIKGSTVTASGDLQTATTTDRLIPLATDALNKLLTARYLIVKAVLKTSTDQTGKAVDVKFNSTYTMKINLGLKAGLKADITF